MSRQPTQDLQGLDNVATPSATMVDAYAGAPGMPRESSAGQLADALGTLSRAGMKSAAQAKADKEKLDAEKAATYAARFKGEEGEFLDSVKLGETHAHLSDTVVAKIVQDKHHNDFYSKTKAHLNGLDNDLRFNVVALEKEFERLVAEASEKTEGMDFVQSGAVSGTVAAITELRSTFSSQRDKFTREQSKTNTQASISNILDKYDLSTNDGQISAVTLINDLDDTLKETSPFSKSEDKQIIVDALITYNKNNPDSGAVNLIQKIPYLQGKVTDQKLNEAAPVIAGLSLQKLRDDAQLKKLQNQQTLDEAQVKFNNLSFNNDKPGIRAAMVKANSLTGEDAALGAAMYKMGEVALASADVDVDVSQEFAATYEDSLVVKAIKGELKRADVLTELASSTDMREEDKEAIRGNLDNIMAGSDLIAASKHSTEFNNRVGDEARAIDTSILNIGGKLEGRSLESRVRDLWDTTVLDLIVEYATENNAKPEGRALRAIYDEAEAITEKRMNKIRGLPTSSPQPEPQPEPQPTLEVGTIITAADGTKAKYLGGDINDDGNFEVITEEEEDTGSSIIEELVETLTQ